MGVASITRALQLQPGDTPTPVFSFLGSIDQHPEQRPCWITQTNETTHAIIRSGLDRSPMFTGVIEGIGPRYCPSIEDKIVRFAHKASHQIFLEPEGLSTNEVYPNGISTSLPFDMQLAAVRSIRGLGECPCTSSRLRHRVRLLRSTRPASDRLKPSRSRGCSSRARSTAPPVTRKPLRRASSPESMPRASSRDSMRGARDGMRPISVC